MRSERSLSLPSSLAFPISSTTNVLLSTISCFSTAAPAPAQGWGCDVSSPAGSFLLSITPPESLAEAGAVQVEQQVSSCVCVSHCCAAIADAAPEPALFPARLWHILFCTGQASGDCPSSRCSKQQHAFCLQYTFLSRNLLCCTHFWPRSLT